ncbi:MAG: hypothetical protein M3088_05910, partial [Actinomycetota bacterium]|nr:hypothetical protein [Actinomycetota bacterium]
MKRVALCASAAAALVAAGCGEEDKSKDEGSAPSAPKAVALELTGSGKKATMKAPASVGAGLAKVTLKNSSKSEGGVQLVRVEGRHTTEEVGKAGAAWGEKGKPLPDWFQLEGGVGST